MARSEFFGTRIRHFIKGFRRKTGLTQEELGRKLGTTKSTVSRIENNQDKHVTHVLSILERLGQLENMELGFFLAYLSGQNLESGQDLFPWQKTILRAFSGVKQSTRVDFIAELSSSSSSRIEALIGLLVQFNRLSERSQDLVVKLVSELPKEK